MSALFATAAEGVKDARINALLATNAKDEKLPTTATNRTVASCVAEGNWGGCFCTMRGNHPDKRRDDEYKIKPRLSVHFKRHATTGVYRRGHCVLIKGRVHQHFPHRRG